MSRREDIDNGVWGDPDFDALSNDAALLYLWSFTNPSCGMAGIYKIAKRKILEGRLEADRLDTVLAELAAANFLVYEQGVLWVRSRVKHLRTKGEPMKRSIELDLEKLPADHPLTARFAEEYAGTWIASVFQGFDRGSGGVQTSGSGERKVGTPAGPPEGSKGKGRGKGKGSGTSTDEGSSDLSREQLRADWDRWLGHFHEITGRTSTTGSGEAKRFFAARRKEGRTVEELMEATVGCHGDDNLRQRGFDRPETILRESKYQRYIELARQAKAQQNGASAAHQAFLDKEVPA